MRTDDQAFENAVSRAFESLQDDFRAMTVEAAEQIAPLCESPIEVMLGTALLCSGACVDGARADNRRFMLCASEGDERESVLRLHPQYQWEGYRIDFAIVMHVKERRIMVFVECDGHDFHERTADQAERDRSKDRKIQEAGITILRFTGREIYRSPSKCVVSILEFFSKRLRG